MCSGAVSFIATLLIMIAGEAILYSANLGLFRQLNSGSSDWLGVLIFLVIWFGLWVALAAIAKSRGPARIPESGDTSI